MNFWMSCNNVFLQTLIFINAVSVLLAARTFPNSRLARTIAIAVSCASAAQFADIGGYTLGFWRNLYLVLMGICGYKVFPMACELFLFDKRSLEDRFEGKFRPTFFFCSTTHSRFVPKKHTFKYPILYVGFPVSFEGSVGSVFSVLGARPENAEKAPESGKGVKGLFSFFTVDPANFVNKHLPFSKKLEPVLNHHGIDPSIYPHVYLVTTPKFFGYAFNPVSYWYLYNAEKELKLVVLEVNNTFGEKHLYLLHSDNPSNPRPRKGYTFAGEMEKAFHISPFNHRSGNYQIQVRDPLQAEDPAKVDVHMIVFARDGTKTMVARAFSVCPSLDLLNANAWDGFSTAMTWGWNTFLAVPMTMYEAWKLYKKRAVVYTRPEPLKGSGQRDSTKAEKEMQDMWVEYFGDRVSNYPTPLAVTLTLPESNATRVAKDVLFESTALTSRKECRGCTLHNISCTNIQCATQPSLHLTIRVNNPRFFTRFFSHQDPHHTVYLDILCQPHERQVAHINNLHLFLDVLTKSFTSDISVSHSDEPIRQPVYGLRWRAVSWVRKYKTGIELTKSATAASDVDAPFPPPPPPPYLLHRSAINTLDSYFFSTKTCCSNANREACLDLVKKYRRKTTQAVFMDLVAFGDSESLELYFRMGKLMLWVAVVAFVSIVGMKSGPGPVTLECLDSGATIGWRSWVGVVFPLGIVNAGWVLEKAIMAF